ncbi:hypothetical protein FC50_GL000452 [Lacticaseibacillus pantheris DSM 15945 = JCM 12539 = NBRC 106106]|uniref:Uncharacterized protein n=1 Tax=Lacticaseibacillus pantheris DSM 15945 = JCM 12539 = NBRC 106106 TaxID=1423783 RepID=A0A0R1U0F4_9LACO|nr:hypothetical protein FC50_GL000452 [Lacticaseibacillus pantheris DSM 15945 = JCM 12539 = NBRC 106106]
MIATVVVDGSVGRTDELRLTWGAPDTNHVFPKLRKLPSHNRWFQLAGFVAMAPLNRSRRTKAPNIKTNSGAL